MATTTPGRKRDAAATREAILRSATECFTASGYEGVGVREIARGAGVTAMLVNRYFGSKEGLFTEVVQRAFAPRDVVVSGPETLVQAAARQLVARTSSQSDVLNPFLLLLRSAGCPRAVEIMRASIEQGGENFFSPAISDARGDERAMLATALIAGVWLMRDVVAVPAMVEADPETLSQHIENMLGALFDREPTP